MLRQPTSSHPDRAIEWFSAIVMIGWAIALAQPGDILLGGNLREFLRYGVSEINLAVLCGGVGMLRLGALYINGRWPRSPTLRMLGAGVGMIFWTQVTLVIITTAGLGSTGVAVYGPLAFFELLSIRRAAFDARYHRQ